MIKKIWCIHYSKLRYLWNSSMYYSLSKCYLYILMILFSFFNFINVVLMDNIHIPGIFFRRWYNAHVKIARIDLSKNHWTLWKLYGLLANGYFILTRVKVFLLCLKNALKNTLTFNIFIMSNHTANMPSMLVVYYNPIWKVIEL